MKNKILRKIINKYDGKECLICTINKELPGIPIRDCLDILEADGFIKWLNSKKTKFEWITLNN